MNIFMKQIKKEKEKGYNNLVSEIGELLKESRNRYAVATNTILVKTYWHIGRYIVLYEQNGESKAIYGDELINRLSTDLRQKFGRGFSRSNLFMIRQFYLKFPKIQTVSELYHGVIMLNCLNWMILLK